MPTAVMLAVHCRVMRVVQTGLLDHWMYETFDAAALHSDTQTQSGEAEKEPINLRDLQGAFYVLFIGLTAGMLVFVAEKFARCRVKFPRPFWKGIFRSGSNTVGRI